MEDMLPVSGSATTGRTSGVPCGSSLPQSGHLGLPRIVCTPGGVI